MCFRLVMGKYVVVGHKSTGEISVFNIVQGCPPVRYPFSIDAGSASSLVQLINGSAELVCDEYQIFLFGKIRSKVYPPAGPSQRVLYVVDFLNLDI